VALSGAVTANGGVAEMSNATTLQANGAVGATPRQEAAKQLGGP